MSVFVCVDICICMYMCVCVCIYIYICYIYMCIYIYGLADWNNGALKGFASGLGAVGVALLVGKPLVTLLVFSLPFC